jgi:alpha-N-arabinofuranosidase
VNVTNRHRDQPIDAVIELEDKHFSGGWQASEVNGPDIKAENNFDATPVKTVTKSAGASGTTLKYTFPPHSFTMLKGSVR